MKLLFSFDQKVTRLSYKLSLANYNLKVRLSLQSATITVFSGKPAFSRSARESDKTWNRTKTRVKNPGNVSKLLSELWYLERHGLSTQRLANNHEAMTYDHHFVNLGQEKTRYTALTVWITDAMYVYIPGWFSWWTSQSPAGCAVDSFHSKLVWERHSPDSATGCQGRDLRWCLQTMEHPSKIRALFSFVVPCQGDRWHNRVLIYLCNQYRLIYIQHTKDKIDPDYTSYWRLDAWEFSMITWDKNFARFTSKIARRMSSASSSSGNFSLRFPAAVSTDLTARMP